MTNTKRTASLDEVLADYALASQEFDAKVLQDFVDRYPEHSRALQRYAYIQLSSLPATPEEIDEEECPTVEMLGRQSKLIQRMQKLRGSHAASDVSDAIEKLSSISGDTAARTAAIAVFGSYGHGEDLLLFSLTDYGSSVKDVPDWVYERLGEHIGIVPGALISAGMAMKRAQFSASQRFSSKIKPVEQSSVTWAQVIEDCITDDEVKKSILNRS